MPLATHGVYNGYTITDGKLKKIAEKRHLRLQFFFQNRSTKIYRKIPYIRSYIMKYFKYDIYSLFIAINYFLGSLGRG